MRKINPDPDQDRALTVLSVAYPLAPVGPDAVGGAEQVLSAVDRALDEGGHRSIVVACEGSRTAGELVTHSAPPDPIDDDARARAHQAVRAAIRRVLECTHVDIVHLHGIDFPAYVPPPGPACLVTLHMPPSWYPQSALRPERPGTWLHCVSESQQRQCPNTPVLLPFIPNGVPVQALAAGHHARRGFALMLGRVCPEKGQHLALRAAHLANVPLLVAGTVFPYPWHQEYFANQVAPLLDHKRRWVGAVGFTRKRRLLCAARCLLAPSLVEETASLAAMEAMASGTPVIAFPSGALEEVVEHGRTGFLVHDEQEMAEAILRTGEISPDDCRRAARERFPLHRMTSAYLACYQSLARRMVPA